MFTIWIKKIHIGNEKCFCWDLNHQFMGDGSSSLPLDLFDLLMKAHKINVYMYQIPMFNLQTKSIICTLYTHLKITNYEKFRSKTLCKSSNNVKRYHKYDFDKNVTRIIYSKNIFCEKWVEFLWVHAIII